MPFRYEYECADGHVTELLRAHTRRNDHAECDTCHRVANRIMSLPASPSATRNYEGGMKIAPWTLPPLRDPRTGAVCTNADGSIKMQHVEVGSRREYLDVLKRNGLHELETESDNFVQGGDAKKRQEARKEVELKTEAEDMASMYQGLKQSPERAKAIISRSIKAGEHVSALSAPKGTP